MWKGWEMSGLGVQWEIPKESIKINFSKKYSFKGKKAQFILGDLVEKKLLKCLPKFSLSKVLESH